MPLPCTRTAGILALLLWLLPVRALADFQADSSALIGAWRWVRTYGGWPEGQDVQPPSGWSRILFFRGDGRYAYWERDSVADYLLCSGAVTFHPAKLSSIRDHPARLWVDLEGWCEYGSQQLIAKIDSARIVMYPGSEADSTILRVSDALCFEFASDSTSTEPTQARNVGSLAHYRPPRLTWSKKGPYAVDIYPELRQDTGVYPWQNPAFPRAVRDSYTYTNNQIPSADIGDFDGDSLADIALYGRATGDPVETKVVCLLSNRGQTRTVELLTVRTPGANRNTGPDLVPNLYLTLIPAGQILEKSEPGPPGPKPRSWMWITRTDAILVHRFDGAEQAYYFEEGEFKQGRVARLIGHPPR